MKRFAFATIASLLLSTAALAMPTLKGDITVNAAIVTVGDMFDNAGELAETAIFRAPAPGTTGIVQLADVEAAARLAGVSAFDNVGFTRVRVMRASTTVDAAMLGTMIDDALVQRGALANGVTADVRFDVADIDIKAEAVTTPARLMDFVFQPENNRFSARFEIAGIDTPVDLTGSVQMMTSVPRLTANVPAGAILSADDFEMTSVPLSTASAGRYADIDELVGKELLRPSRSGMMLKASDVSAPKVVARNAVVTVLLKAGPMTLTVKAQALGSAADGEAVDVLNSVTHKILHGIAQANGTVVIDASLIDPVTTTASL